MAMSLLRNFSPGGGDPGDDDEQPTTPAAPEETVPPDVPQPTGGARYAYAAPAAGGAGLVPGTVVESEVVPDPVEEPEAAEKPDRLEEAQVAGDPGPAAGPGPGAGLGLAADRMPAPVAESSAAETVPSPAVEARAPETTPSPTFRPNPLPVPSPRATGGDEPAVRPSSAPGPDSAGPDFSAPLLGDTAGLRARWKEVQGDFVDDPQAAVSDAADLVGQTAEALVGALRQRQRQLRAAWERGAADGSPDGRSPAGVSAGAMAPGVPDTEHLRLMMQRYRALFNQLCRPS